MSTRFNPFIGKKHTKINFTPSIATNITTSEKKISRKTRFAFKESSFNPTAICAMLQNKQKKREEESLLYHESQKFYNYLDSRAIEYMLKSYGLEEMEDFEDIKNLCFGIEEDYLTKIGKQLKSEYETTTEEENKLLLQEAISFIVVALILFYNNNGHKFKHTKEFIENSMDILMEHYFASNDFVKPTIDRNKKIEVEFRDKDGCLQTLKAIEQIMFSLCYFTHVKQTENLDEEDLAIIDSVLTFNTELLTTIKSKIISSYDKIIEYVDASDIFYLGAWFIIDSLFQEVDYYDLGFDLIKLSWLKMLIDYEFESNNISDYTTLYIVLLFSDIASKKSLEQIFKQHEKNLFTKLINFVLDKMIDHFDEAKTYEDNEYVKLIGSIFYLTIEQLKLVSESSQDLLEPEVLSKLDNFITSLPQK